MLGVGAAGLALAAAPDGAAPGSGETGVAGPGALSVLFAVAAVSSLARRRMGGRAWSADASSLAQAATTQMTRTLHDLID